MKRPAIDRLRRCGILCLLLCGLVRGAWADSVTLNLKDADIGALITTVAEVTGRNFVVDPRVKGKVTVVSSRPMDSKEVYQVFLSILKVHGFAAVPAGTVIKIVPDVNAKQDAIPMVSPGHPGRGDEMVTSVIHVEHVAAAQMVPILRPLVPQQGHLAAYPPTNVLIISDRADNVARLVAIIRRIDRASEGAVDVIPLEHASAAEVVRILNSLSRGTGAKRGIVAAGGPVIIADERTNSVLLGGDRTTRLRLRAIIAHLDTPLERGGNTRVVYLKYAKAKDLVKVLQGVSSSISQKGKGKVRPQGGKVNIEADEASNALVITAPPDVFRSLSQVIRKLDVRRAQVLIEAVIAEINMNRALELGIQWRATTDFNKNGVVGGTNFGKTTSSINSVAANPLGAGNGFTLGYFEGTSDVLGTQILNLGALVRALANDTSTNILSTPNIITLDNQEAKIVVAQNVPFVTGQFTNTGANNSAVNPFQTIERQDVGLTLKVKPQINEGNTVRLDIEQESSSVSDSAVPGAADIVTNKRSIKTSVMVEDRHVIVLGGLMDDQLTETVEKVPLLGDIPILGNLFKAKKRTKNKKDLMVFLRPVILRDAATETAVSASKYNYLRGRQMEFRRKGGKAIPEKALPRLPPLPGEELPWLQQPAPAGKGQR